MVVVVVLAVEVAVVLAVMMVVVLPLVLVVVVFSLVLCFSVKTKGRGGLAFAVVNPLALHFFCVGFCQAPPLLKGCRRWSMR